MEKETIILSLKEHLGKTLDESLLEKIVSETLAAGKETAPLSKKIFEIVRKNSGGMRVLKEHRHHQQFLALQSLMIDVISVTWRAGEETYTLAGDELNKVMTSQQDDSSGRQIFRFTIGGVQKDLTSMGMKFAVSGISFFSSFGMESGTKQPESIVLRITGYN